MSTWNLPPGVTTNDPHINPKDDDDSHLIAVVFGRKARFHNDACRDGFREDRKHSLIYPTYDVGGQLMSVEDASMAAEFCAYCGD